MRKSRIDKATAAWVAFYGVWGYATLGAFLASWPWNAVDGVSSAGLGVFALGAALVRWSDRRAAARQAAYLRELLAGTDQRARAIADRAIAETRPASTLNPYRPPTDADLRRWRETDRQAPNWRDLS